MRSRLWGGALALVVSTLLAVAFAAPAAGESPNRALESAVKKGRFSAAEGARLQRAVAAARQAGVDEREAQRLVAACVEGEFDASQAQRVLSIASQLVLEGLPVGGFVSKLEEGISKGIAADRVVQVAERRALMLNTARLMLNSLVLQGFTIGDRDELLPDLAAALEAGRQQEEALAILSEALRSGESAGAIRRKLFP